jgi:hypothetical protein
MLHGVCFVQGGHLVAMRFSVPAHRLAWKQPDRHSNSLRHCRARMAHLAHGYCLKSGLAGCT